MGQPSSLYLFLIALAYHPCRVRVVILLPRLRPSIEIGFSRKKVGFICFNEGHLKMMKNGFYFILKTLKIFTFLSWTFGHTEKMVWLER